MQNNNNNIHNIYKKKHLWNFENNNDIIYFDILK